MAQPRPVPGLFLAVAFVCPIVYAEPAPPAETSPIEKDGGASPTFFSTTFRIREARCATAICWGQAFKWAVEPLVELPIGKSFASNGMGALANFENSHDLSATFTAGIRGWFWHDVVSLSVYLSKPLFSQSGSVRVSGSSFEYSVQNVRRPYPGIALGFLADSLWFGIDIDELRNGDTDATRDPNFLRNAVVSRAIVYTIALSPVTIARNALGAASGASKAPPAASGASNIPPPANQPASQ